MKRIGYTLWICALVDWAVFMVLVSIGCQRFVRNMGAVQRAIPAGPMRAAYWAGPGH